jgi:serine/threonine-protein kinase
MIGNVIGGYEIQALLGHGGMGTVYLAGHTRRGTSAAVKILRRAFVEDEALVDRFVREIQATRALRHPHVAEVLEVGRLEDGLVYLVMEALAGENLGQRLRRRRRLTVTEVLAVVEPAAAALGAAHTRGVVHGDLKPENLFFAAGAAGGQERVVVTDFGMGALLTACPRTRRTTRRTQASTPVYLSPEQCRGEAATGPGTDVYALGTLVYEMLCGCAPFGDGRGPAHVLASHQIEAPAPPYLLDPTIPEAVEAVILRALAKDPGERFASTEALATALRAAAEASPAARPTAIGRPRLFTGLALARS